jgi:hypothetical protein
MGCCGVLERLSGVPETILMFNVLYYTSILVCGKASYNLSQVNRAMMLKSCLNCLRIQALRLNIFEKSDLSKVVIVPCGVCDRLRDNWLSSVLLETIGTWL